MTGLVEGLIVRPERMRENIERGLGLHASSRVLLALVERGGHVPRGRLRRSSSGPRCAPPTSARPLRGAARRRPGGRRDAVPGRPRRLLRRRAPPAPRPDRHRAPRCASCPRRRPPAPMADARAFLRSGKVRDLYRVRDDATPARGIGSPVGVRCRPADADPGQGPRPDRPVAVLVRGDARTSWPTTCCPPSPPTSRAGPWRSGDAWPTCAAG